MLANRDLNQFVHNILEKELLFQIMEHGTNTCCVFVQCSSVRWHGGLNIPELEDNVSLFRSPVWEHFCFPVDYNDNGQSCG